MVHNTHMLKNLEVASKLILDGKIIIYSTDTLYGFGVDATNSAAIEKINKIKKRNQPYSIIVSSFKMLKVYSRIDEKIESTIKNILPGPYTVILNKNKSNLSSLVSLNFETTFFH